MQLGSDMPILGHCGECVVTSCMAVAVLHIALFMQGEVCTCPGMLAGLLKCMMIHALPMSDKGSLTKLA